MKQPASTFVKHADRAVSVKLVRPGDISHALQLAHALQTSAGDILPDALQSPAVPGLPISSSSAVPPGMPPAYTAVAQQPSEEGELEAAIAASLCDLRQDTARTIEQVESYQTAEAQRHSMLQRLPSSMVKVPHVTWLSPLLP